MGSYKILNEILSDQIKTIIDEVEDMYPYKVSGDHSTYSQYNEAWSDACSTLGQKILDLFKTDEDE